jgi:hypothetical protein
MSTIPQRKTFTNEAFRRFAQLSPQSRGVSTKQAVRLMVPQGAKLDPACERYMRILERARAGDFGLDGFGRAPGVWPAQYGGVRLGNQVDSQIFTHREACAIAEGCHTPELYGYDHRKPVTEPTAVGTAPSIPLASDAPQGTLERKKAG